MRPNLYALIACGVGLTVVTIYVLAALAAHSVGLAFAQAIPDPTSVAVNMPGVITVAVPTYAIDFRPFFDQVIMPALSTLALAVVPILAAWISVKLANFLHIKSSAALSDQVLGAVTNAAKFAVNEAQAADTHLTVTTHDQMIAKAAQYLNENVPGKMAALGLTPDHIDNLIRSALPPPAVVAAAQRQSTAAPPPTPTTKAE